MKGYVHSVESLGTLDGPGLRTVIFLQGCSLRCQFCHNPDSWLAQGGTLYSVDELFAKVMKNKNYWGDKGGVTLSGGSPLFQAEFSSELIKKFHQAGVHVAVDESLNVDPAVIDDLISEVDLWMVSVKHMDEQKHQELTGVSNQRIQSNLRYLDEKLSEFNQGLRDLASDQKKHLLRIRFLVIPGWTDDEAHLKEVAKLIKSFKNLETVEVLGYGSHGAFKWENLYGSYPFAGVRDATEEDVARVKKILE